jgi:hypothetical protein
LVPVNRCARPTTALATCRPDGDPNTSWLADAGPSVTPERSSVTRVLMKTEAFVARTSAVDVDIANDRYDGGVTSPIPTWLNVTPGANAEARLPT